MGVVLRKLHGMMGIGLAWGILWAAITAVIGVIIGVLDPDSIDPREGPLVAASASASAAMARRAELREPERRELLNSESLPT